MGGIATDLYIIALAIDSKQCSLLKLTQELPKGPSCIE